MKRIEKITIAILTGLCLGFLIGALTSCVAKHPKCAAYDKIEHDPLIKTNLDRSLYK